jgi:hypothetical protein
MTDASGGKEPRKREPTIIAAWIGGILGVVGIVAGILTDALGRSPQPGQSSTTVSSPPAAEVATTSPAEISV